MKAKLTIHFDSLWHTGSGQAGGRDLDALFERDEDELPLLGGRRLRGLIKDAARLHAEHTRTPPPLTPEKAFGGEGGRPVGADTAVEASDAGIIRVRNAVMPRGIRRELLSRRRVELAGISEAVASTAIKNGVPLKNTLRRIEFAVPISLEAELSCNAPGKEQEIFSWLKAVLRLVRYAGRARHRGFGRCHAELEETPGAPAKTTAPAKCLKLVFRLTLKDGVVVSAHGGSAGLHQCLDYIPGSALWGVAATRLYGKWAGEGEAGWKKIAAVFHSGKVRFHCARPASVTTGAALFPTPLAWHFTKGERFTEAMVDFPDRREVITNDDNHLASCAAQPWKPEHGQPQQARSGWFSVTGEFFQLAHRHYPKTAVDKDNFDRAEDKKFFGYMALEPKEQFVTCLEADDGMDGWDEVREVLEGSTEIELGRSKAAEFGRATVTKLGEEAWPIPTAETPPTPGLVLFHALSDLALVDDYGQPTLTPLPEKFGLNARDYRPETERTFLQVRRYSPWNSFRNTHDAERVVIRAGSVIAFQRKGDAQAHADIAKLPRRVGCWQEQGLGLVAVNPKYLFSIPTPTTVTATGPREDQPAFEASPLPAEALPLARAVHRRFCHQAIQALAIALGRDWKAEWSMRGSGLSKSQWARLREEAVRASSRDELLQSLDEERGLFKHGLSARKWEPPGEEETLAQAIRNRLKDDANLRNELQKVGVPARGADGEDLVSCLALQACREAAIACARAKQENRPL